ncbi:MAG TPA: flavodoxin family protein [Thermotogota bacterium]|nr:flavodoxin family protein [Thermotogota bacterium]HPR94999.1 flavodoxin family protein [Thermotogota bacterium]
MQLKRVVALNTSRRNKNTFTLLKNIGSLLNESDIELEIINCHQYDIRYCNGCELCITKDFCPLDDDVADINEKLIAADGIIFSTPVYMENLSGILKTFIDRNCKWFHRSPLIKKPFLAVSTTMSSGLKPTLKYLNIVATRWGMIPCGNISRRLNTFKIPISTGEVDTFIRFIQHPESVIQYISLSKAINFNVQKALALNLFEIDRKYWINSGLADQKYYYRVLMNPLSNCLGKFLFRVISKGIKKTH